MSRNSYAEVETSTLVASDYNPNTMRDDEFKALVQEVENNQRLMKPIIVRVCDGKHVIVDGHFNWAAAREVGLPTVPVEVIEADEFEARRQTIIRNRTGRKDNLLLGRVYSEMLIERNISNRELADTLGISEGSVRNQLLYPEAWEWLRQKGSRCTNLGRPTSTEAYVWQGRIYTERRSALSTGAAAEPIAKLAVRDLRALIASLQGLAEEGQDQPGAAESEARIFARLKRAWNKATDDERIAFLEWTGYVTVTRDQHQTIAAPESVTDDRQMDLEDFTEAEPPLAPPEPTEEFAEDMADEMPQPNGELRNGYADDPSELGRRVREARIARNWTQGELAEAAGTHGPIISQIENGKLGKVGKATLQRVAAAVL